MPSVQRKKIGLLYAGALSNREPGLKQWLAGLPELGIIADISPLSSGPGDASGRNFTVAAAAIARNYALFDGFVVLCGHDQLLYLAAALSFSLTGLGKPVVAVGGEIAVDRPGELVFGLKADLINAVQAATLRFAEVCIMSGNRLLRGNAASHIGGSTPGTFEAPAGAVLGRIDFSIRLMERNLRPIPKTRMTVASLAPRVDYIQLTPWHDAGTLQQHLDDVSAMLLNARTSASLPAWLQRWLKTTARKPVAVLTAHPSIVIESKGIALPTGTPEAMLAKLAWATALAKSPSKVAALMVRDVAGEFSV